MARKSFKNRIVGYAEIDPEQLLANPLNWRIHPQAQQEALEGVLSDVGWVDDVIVNKNTGYVLDGHLRVALSISNNEETIPVKYVDLDEDEEKLILATIDPIAAMAATDKELLEGLLGDIQTDNEQVIKALNDIAKAENILLPVEEDPGPQIDKADELLEKWQVERGQIWQIGDHRLMCGDSTREDDVDRLLDGNKPYLMVTDPPYGVNYDPNWRNEAAAKGQLAYAARRVGKVTNDDQTDWSITYSLFPCSVLYTWSPGGDYIIITGQAILDAGFQIRNQIIWAKSNFPISRGHYTYRHEPCWYAVRKGATAKWVGANNECTLWPINLDKNVDGGHSTQKPLECMARPIRNHKGDVADPFIGSGTTMVAAQQLNRHCYGMEISERYCAVTLERMSGMGLTPELISNG